MSTHQGRPQAKPHPRVNLRPGPARPGAVPNWEKNGLAWAITAHAIRDPCPAPALPVFRRSHLGLRHKSSVFFLGLGNCPWPSAWQRRAGNGRCYCASPLRKKEGNFLCRGSASGISGRPVNAHCEKKKGISFAEEAQVGYQDAQLTALRVVARRWHSRAGA